MKQAELVIDIGSRHTTVCSRGVGVLIHEPTVAAISNRGGKLALIRQQKRVGVCMSRSKHTPNTLFHVEQKGRVLGRNRNNFRKAVSNAAFVKALFQIVFI